MSKNSILKTLACVLAAVLLLSACGAGGSGSSKSGVIKVGILGPLTGGVSEYGIAVRDGAKLCIEQLNEKGGIGGNKKIEIIEYDEEGDPTQALTGYNDLVDKGVTAIIGSVTSGPTMAVVREGFNDNMPMITASATAAGVTYNEDGTIFTNMFRSCFIDPFQGEKMADFSTGVLNAKKAAVIFNTGVDYSIGLKDAFLEKAAAVGMEVVAIEGYADAAVDFQSQLTNIAAKSPDVLFVPDYYNTVALLSQQARNAGVTATLLGADGWDTVVEVMSDRAPVEGSYYCSGYSSEDTTPMVQEFLSAFKTKYGSDPNMFSAQGYDAAKILIAALEKTEASMAGKAGTEDYRKAVISAMKATDMDCVTGHVTYDKYNNPIKSAVIININGGEARFWGKY